METIYDHSPSAQELKELGSSSIPRERYISSVDVETAWVDIALLFGLRGDAEAEMRAWDMVPERRDEFIRGFDTIILD